MMWNMNLFSKIWNVFSWLRMEAFLRSIREQAYVKQRRLKQPKERPSAPLKIAPSAMSFLCVAPELFVGVYATACFIVTVSVAISSSIHVNPDDYYTDSNFTIFTYHLPEDAEFNLSLGYLGVTDMPVDGEYGYNAYDIIGEGDKAASPATPKTTSKPKGKDEQDKIELFLEMVEEYEQNKAKCSPGTGYNLGSGVIKQYGLNRFKSQAMIAVNRANFLTRIWKVVEKNIVDSEYLFYAQVRSIVEGDPDIFAAGNCYDKDEFKNYHLFCPFAYRMEDGRINVKDLSLEYDYLGNTSEFFFSARMKAAHLENFNVTKGVHYVWAYSWKDGYDD